MKNFLITTVIIQTQNIAKYLDLTLQSLLIQSIHPSNFEVVILCDFEHKELRRLINFYTNVLKIELCVGEKTKNEFIQNNKSDLCILIKAGLSLNKNCIEAHQREHQKSTEKIVVVGYVQKAISINREDTNNFFEDSREEHYSKYDDRIDLLPAPWVFFSSANVSIKREDLTTIGLFDENYDGDSVYQDMDLGYRLCQIKNKMLLNRTATCIDYLPLAFTKESLTENNSRNRFYFHGKYDTMETKMLKNIPTERIMYLNDHIIQLFE
jgi:hypothetical protein